MWICLNNAFFSVVDPQDGSDNLLVRARREGDIEKVFPEAEVQRTPGRDYLFRAFIYRRLVAAAIADQLLGIDYNNFKNSVTDDKLHSAYGSFWNTHARLQEIPPYAQLVSRGNRNQI